MDGQLFGMILVVSFAGALLQSVVGFAFALLTLPCLLMLGVGLPEAVMCVSGGSLVQRCMAVVYLRHEIRVRELTAPALTIVAALPVGVLLARQLNGLDPVRVRQVVGLLVLAALLARWCVRVAPREQVSAVWGYVAGAASGLLTGMAGIGGPPLVLWGLAHNWSSPRMRVAILAVVMPATPVLLGLFWWTFGHGAMVYFLWGLLATPAILAGGYVGFKVGDRFSAKGLRVAVQVVLVIIAATAIFKPYL